MLEKFKANILFTKLLQRPDINKAYAMVGPEDSWYDTITKVHNSLKEIQELPHELLEITSHAEREWAFPGLFYLSLGCNVLIPYQRAHGLSEGKYITFGAFEHLDMLKWIERVNEINPEGSVIVHGLSMGGGIVLDLADKDMKNVKGIISDAPSVSIKAFFENISKDVFKKSGAKVAKCAIQRFEKEFGVDINHFECINIAANSKYPILLSAGSNEHMDDVLQAIKKANPKETEIIILPGCNHGNGMYKQTELYQGRIKAFINKVIGEM